MQNHIINYKIFMSMSYIVNSFRLEDEVIATGIEEVDNNLIGEDYDGSTDDGINTIQGPTQTLTLVGSAVLQQPLAILRWWM